MADTEFIVAKVRGMRGKLYEGKRLAQLCSLPDAEDLAAILAPDELIGDSIALQRHLTTRHVESLHKILPHLDGREAELFLWMLRRYQVENLKVICRCWAAKSEKPVLSAYTVPLPDEFALPTEQLMKCADLEELIARMPVASLREGAMLGLGDFEESGRLFFVEAGIDKAYFTELRDLAERTGGPGRSAVQHLVSLELDIYNVMLVLRSLFNYSIGFNKIRVFLAPSGAQVRASALAEIRSAPDIDAAARLVPPALVGTEAGPLSGDQVETAMWRNLYRVANRHYYGCVLDFGAVAAFYYIKRVELGNLIRISECVRYAEPADAIRDKLIELRPSGPARSR